MARRRTTNREYRAIGSLIILVVVLGFIIQAIEGVGAFLGAIDPHVYIGAAVLFGTGVAVYLVVKNIVRRKRENESLSIADAASRGRYQELFSKYKNNEIVAKIMNRLIWMGMTKEQLQDSLGPPEATGREVTKTKVFEEYRYGQVGKNRFSSRVQLENDVVVGWSKK